MSVEEISVPVCALLFVHICAHVCGGPSVSVRSLLDPSPPLLFEAGATYQTQSSLIWLVSLASLLEILPVSSI